MTSNLGAHLIQENFAHITSENEFDVVMDTKDQVFELLKKTIRPEFLNRVDEIVMFRPLGMQEMRKIVNIQFAEIQKRLEESNIRLEADDAVLDYLAEIGFDPQFGARPLKRVMQRKILNELSKEILAGKINKDAVVALQLDDDRNIQFINIDDIELA
jgi:ATP-dependent Clp protease ATP-binding subunit ClpB